MKIKTGLGVVVILGLIVFAGCTSPQKDTAEGSCDIVLKSYKVPERLAEQISKTVNDLLSRDARTRDKDQPPIGKAQVAPDGELLVAAPKSFHDGLKDFIASVANTKPEPSLTTEVNYWIVAGRKAKTRAKLDEFTGIQPALDTIQNSQGNMEFKLLDHLVITSSGQGTRSDVQGSLSRITQQISADSTGTLVIKTDSQINSDIRWGNHISTQIEIKSGELVVLGQASQEFRGVSIFNPIINEEAKKNHVELVNVYYIISATVKK